MNPVADPVLAPNLPDDTAKRASSILERVVLENEVVVGWRPLGKTFNDQSHEILMAAKW